jgi:hypothetical protein
MRTFAFTSILAILSLHSWLLAQAPATQPHRVAPDIVRLRLHPVATTSPVLRYRLLPQPIDLSPGNAATLYDAAGKVFPEAKNLGQLIDKAEDTFDVPVDKLSASHVEQALAPFSQSLGYAELAARREDARWDVGMRDRGFAVVMLHLNDMKVLCNVLAVRSRLQVAQRDWDGASNTLQTGFGMARQLGDQPLLIHALVESGIVQQMAARGLEEWITRDDSPNLYWPLTMLPSPFVDMPAVEQWEQGAVYFTFPELRRIEKGEFPADQWPAFLRKMTAALAALRLGGVANARQESAPDPDAIDQEVKSLIESSYPRARESLVQNGQKVEMMSREHVVGLYLCRQYRDVCDQLWSSWGLPFPVAMEQMARADRELASKQEQLKANPLIQTLPRVGVSGNPSLMNARYALARTDWEISQLRVLEALRDYAARHDGQPPRSLDQITNLPVPVNPFTGQAFEYRVQGQLAILEANAPAGRRGRRLELTFVR